MYPTVLVEAISVQTPVGEVALCHLYVIVPAEENTAGVKEVNAAGVVLKQIV